jgi:hypothetical protein
MHVVKFQDNMWVCSAHGAFARATADVAPDYLDRAVAFHIKDGHALRASIVDADGGDIRTLSDEQFDPISEKTQSEFSQGFCEKCHGTIACGERHLARHWKGGLAEATQHIDCQMGEQG